MLDQVAQQIWVAINQLNHDYTTLTATVSEMQIDLAVLKSQVGEMVWVWPVIGGAVILFIITRLLKLIANNKKKNKSLAFSVLNDFVCVSWEEDGNTNSIILEKEHMVEIAKKVSK